MRKLFLLLALLTLTSCRDQSPEHVQLSQAEKELAESYRQMKRQEVEFGKAFYIHWNEIGFNPSYCISLDSRRLQASQLSTIVRDKLRKIELTLKFALNGDNASSLKDSLNNREITGRLISSDDRIQVDSVFNKFQKFMSDSFAHSLSHNELDAWKTDWGKFKKDLQFIHPLEALHKVKRLDLEFYQLTETKLLTTMNSCSSGGFSIIEPKIHLDSNVLYKGQMGKAKIYLVAAFKHSRMKIIVNGRPIPIERGEGVFNFKGEKPGKNNVGGYIEVSNSATGEIKHFPFTTDYYVIDAPPAKK